MIRLAVTSLVLASVVSACGSAPPAQRVETTAGGNNPRATVAAKASEPRTNDPTGLPPPAPAQTPSPDPAPAKFGSVGMTGAPPEPEPSAATAKARPSRIGARHVLIQWMGAQHAKDSVVRSKEQAYNLAKEVHRRAKAKEDFARLAVEYSDEPNAGQRGGSLGRFGHGQMVPEFEAAAFKLDIGQISEIVESPFGFHVIQRTE